MAKFNEDGSIETYVELRRRFPEQDLKVSRFAAFEQLLAMEERLRDASIDPAIVAGVLDGDAENIETLSLQLLEKIVARIELLRQGETGVQRRNRDLSDSFINYLVVMMLEAIEQHGEPLPPSLLVLTREQLGGAKVELHTAYRLKSSKMDAVWIAIQLQELGKEPSINAIARALGVEPSTVMRWFPNGGLQQAIERTRSQMIPGTLEKIRLALGLPPND